MFGEHADDWIVQCPSEDCEGTKAFFMQIQIRSADEPMTLFYKVGASNMLWTGRVGAGTILIFS